MLNQGIQYGYDLVLEFLAEVNLEFFKRTDPFARNNFVSKVFDGPIRGCLLYTSDAADEL